MNLIKKHHRIISLTVMTVLLTGCSQGHSPFIPMLGAYFPYWMLCTFIGLLGAFCLRVLFIYWGIDDKLPVPLLFYFAIMLSISLTISLLYFTY
ncbi:YtcA family lipoprotein [Proteus mirabilis]|uniref:YtcA family lipoprotein n=1 Tax=Proteus mirabilis TaxID=584 RepID=UPI0013192A45|nr:YtcA family lipoprotein [Proteus mirabilis]QHA70539.1 hypothetical protein GO498_09300 [Proteus mirabilis]